MTLIDFMPKNVRLHWINYATGERGYTDMSYENFGKGRSIDEIKQDNSPFQLLHHAERKLKGEV